MLCLGNIWMPMKEKRRGWLRMGAGDWGRLSSKFNKKFSRRCRRWRSCNLICMLAKMQFPAKDEDPTWPYMSILYIYDI